MSLVALAARRLPPEIRQWLRSAALRAAAVAYAGSGVTCPCCGRTFRRFAPFKGRPNEQCPGCGSLARHRALFLFLRDELRLEARAGRILHFAPEPALQRWLARLPGAEYVSADLDSPRADMRIDVTDIPFADASFDVVLCGHVLEHVPDDRRAIAELHRVLAAGGDAIVQVPIRGDVTFEAPDVVDPAERARVFGQFDHVRVPGRDYVERLRDAGFAVDEHDLPAGVEAEAVARHGLKHGEIFYHCRKSWGDGASRDAGAVEP
jgi:SAM-dependent methyltransferase